MVFQARGKERRNSNVLNLGVVTRLDVSDEQSSTRPFSLNSFLNYGIVRFVVSFLSRKPSRTRSFWRVSICDSETPHPWTTSRRRKDTPESSTVAEPFRATTLVVLSALELARNFKKAWFAWRCHRRSGSSYSIAHAQRRRRLGGSPIPGS